MLTWLCDLGLTVVPLCVFCAPPGEQGGPFLPNTVFSRRAMSEGTSIERGGQHLERLRSHGAGRSWMQGRDPSQPPTVLLPETMSATQLLLTGPVMGIQELQREQCPQNTAAEGTGLRGWQASK